MTFQWNDGDAHCGNCGAELPEQNPSRFFRETSPWAGSFCSTACQRENAGLDDEPDVDGGENE